MNDLLDLAAVAIDDDGASLVDPRVLEIVPCFVGFRTLCCPVSLLSSPIGIRVSFAAFGRCGNLASSQASDPDVDHVGLVLVECWPLFQQLLRQNQPKSRRLVGIVVKPVNACDRRGTLNLTGEILNALEKAARFTSSLATITYPASSSETISKPK